MQKWEYIFLKNTVEDNIKTNSNKLGELGWEIVGIVANGDDEAVIIFKRPLKD